jgi:hypothetical protein
MRRTGLEFKREIKRGATLGSLIDVKLQTITHSPPKKKEDDRLDETARNL